MTLLWDIEVEIGKRGDRDAFKDGLCVRSVGSLVIERAVARNGLVITTLSIGLLANCFRDIHELRKTIHTAIWGC